MLDTFRQSATHALRRLLRARGFTVAVIVTLTLAIGATATVFSAVEGVLIHSLPYVRADRLVMVWEDLTKSNNNRFSVSLLNYEDIRQHGSAFEDAAAQLGSGMTVRVGDTPELARGAQVTGNYFALLGARAALGRVLGPGDTIAGSRRVVVLSDAMWRSRLHADPAVIGTVLDIDGEPYTVVGVMAREFSTPAFFKAAHQRAELWAPLDLPVALQTRNAAMLQVIGRLRNGVDADGARRSVRQLGARLAAEYPASNTNVSFDVVPLPEQIIGGVKPILEAMFAAVVLLLLVAVANVSNLFLTRAVSRQGEIAIRRALGASTLALLREALWDSLLLVMTSTILGLALAQWGHALLVAIAPPTTSRLDQIRLDAGVALFTVLIALTLGAALAVVSAGRGMGARSSELLRSGTRRTTAGSASSRARRAVASAQVALAFVLTVGAGLMVRTLLNLDRIDPASVRIIWSPCGSGCFPRATRPPRSRPSISVESRRNSVPYLA
ncbi:MAG: ABC transporter permease [Gemmatimonadota bacterium]